MNKILGQQGPLGSRHGDIRSAIVSWKRGWYTIRGEQSGTRKQDFGQPGRSLPSAREGGGSRIRQMGFRSQCISDNTMANPMGILRHNLSRGCLGRGHLGWETEEGHKGPSSWRVSPSLQLICKFFREEPQPMHLQRCHKRRFFLRCPPSGATSHIGRHPEPTSKEAIF